MIEQNTNGNTVPVISPVPNLVPPGVNLEQLNGVVQMALLIDHALEKAVVLISSSILEHKRFELDRMKAEVAALKDLWALSPEIAKAWLETKHSSIVFDAARAGAGQVMSDLANTLNKKY